MSRHNQGRIEKGISENRSKILSMKAPFFTCLLILLISVGSYAEESVVSQIPGVEEGATIACRIYPPKTLPEGRTGLVIHLYGSGGSHREGQFNIGRPPFDQFRQMLAERGYWLVVPELGPKHWMNDRACLQVDAVIDEMVRAHPIDRKRVHFLGSSMGAGNSLIYIMRRPGKIRSVVAVFPMTDFRRWLEEQPRYRAVVEKAHSITDDTRDTALKNLSPLLHPEAFRDVPVFLLHGDRDPIVPPHHSREFAAALEESGSKVVFREAADGVHNDEIARPFQRELVEFITGVDD